MTLKILQYNYQTVKKIDNSIDNSLYEQQQTNLNEDNILQYNKAASANQTVDAIYIYISRLHFSQKCKITSRVANSVAALVKLLNIYIIIYTKLFLYIIIKKLIVFIIKKIYILLIFVRIFNSVRRTHYSINISM